MRLRLQVQLPETLALPVSDLCMLISNILDNGLEACINNEQPEHRELSFSLVQQRGFLLLTSSNPVEPAAQPRRVSALHSTPSGGQGPEEIRRLTEQYRGGCEYGITDGVFHIQVLLPHDLEVETLYVTVHRKKRRYLHA